MGRPNKFAPPCCKQPLTIRGNPSGGLYPSPIKTFYAADSPSRELIVISAMACTIDFRRLDEGLGGQKNKRKRLDPIGDGVPESMDVDLSIAADPPAKRPALPSLDNPEKPAFGRPTYDGVIAGRVSGRKWKQPRTQRASAAAVSLRGTTFELRNKEKELKRAYKERMTELKEEIRRNKEEKRKKREEREKRKRENTLRTGTKFQKITNPKTLKKIAKSKQRKQLKVIPDELLQNKVGGKTK
ncbi:hypothetical protein ZIOFF_021020 [Zingiber officinale]|uniref:Coiled-coil domain-containing protein 86 n=2 Tax=Zingiber officinale TaxID=94328 RepID=A0A8J5LLR1_ZINOF|nr:hypothetical protein ZIOFF_021020 [Zingiber officinale]